MKISKSITWIGAAVFAVAITAGCNRNDETSTAGAGGQESSTAGAGGPQGTSTADAGRQLDTQERAGTGTGTGTGTDGAQAPMGDQQGANVTDKIDDEAITAKVKTAITGEPELKAAKINVKVANGVVVLSGAVDSPTTVDRANQIAQAVAGVKSVDNRLTVKQG